MKVIFLDVDGVLNSHTYLTRPDSDPESIFRDFDESRVMLLRQIVEATGAELVLSSSWRGSLDENLRPLDYEGTCLLSALASHGLELRDQTPLLYEDRGLEINRWLEAHPETEAFVILDDDDFEWGELTPRWVKTSYYTGLTGEHVGAAIRLLGEDAP